MLYMYMLLIKLFLILWQGKVYNYMDKPFSKEQIEAWLRDIQSESTDTQAQCKSLFTVTVVTYKLGVNYMNIVEKSNFSQGEVCNHKIYCIELHDRICR